MKRLPPERFAFCKVADRSIAAPRTRQWQSSIKLMGRPSMLIECAVLGEGRRLQVPVLLTMASLARKVL